MSANMSGTTSGTCSVTTRKHWTSPRRRDGPRSPSFTHASFALIRYSAISLIWMDGHRGRCALTAPAAFHPRSRAPGGGHHTAAAGQQPRPGDRRPRSIPRQIAASDDSDSVPPRQISYPSHGTGSRTRRWRSRIASGRHPRRDSGAPCRGQAPGCMHLAEANSLHKVHRVIRHSRQGARSGTVELRADHQQGRHDRESGRGRGHPMLPQPRSMRSGKWRYRPYLLKQRAHRSGDGDHGDLRVGRAS